MGVLGYIPDDGYTETAVLRGLLGVYPRVEFTYRPLTIEEIVNYESAAEKFAGMQLRRLAARCITSHVKRWDLEDYKKEPLPIADEVVMKLKEPLFNRLFNVITGRQPPDESPGQTELAQSVSLDDALASLDSGRPLQSVREDRERKNS